MTRFIGDDGSMPEWLEVLGDGSPRVRADRRGAAQLLAAAARSNDGLGNEVERILRSHEGLPLVGGLVYWNLIFSQLLFGDKQAQHLELLALNQEFQEPPK